MGWGTLKYQPEAAVEDNRWIVESWPQVPGSKYWADPKVRKTEFKFIGTPKVKESAMTFKELGLESTVVHLGIFWNRCDRANRAGKMQQRVIMPRRAHT